MTIFFKIIGMFFAGFIGLIIVFGAAFAGVGIKVFDYGILFLAIIAVAVIGGVISYNFTEKHHNAVLVWPVAYVLGFSIFAFDSSDYESSVSWKYIMAFVFVACLISGLVAFFKAEKDELNIF